MSSQGSDMNLFLSEFLPPILRSQLQTNKCSVPQLMSVLLTEFLSA